MDDEQKKSDAEAEDEAAKKKIQELEDDPPEKLSDWPDDKAKYETFGGPEGDHSYDEGPESNLGPSSLRHQEGGGVTIEGEEVDNPEEYKGDPIPGGPTDPDTPDDSLEKDDDDGDGDRDDSSSEKAEGEKRSSEDDPDD